MSEPVTKQRPSIDLDDFERRMRPAYVPHHDDDPLAELARLVGEQPDPYHDVFAHEAAAPSYQHDQQYHQAEASRAPSSFAAIEAGLRGGISPHHEQTQYQPGYGADDGTYSYAPEQPVYGARPPSRRPIYLMAATIAVGVLGVGAAFALKGHATSPSEVKTIMAASGPDKVQPPAESASDASGQDAAVLGKNGQPSPTKLVSNEEEPVDVAQSVKDNAAKDGVDGHTDAASVPVPPPPNQAAGDASQVAPGGDFGLGMPPPKRVKVVSVRPDGTIVSGDPSPPPPAVAPAAPEVHAAAPADDSTPAPAAPAPVVAKPSTPHAPAPKSATRIVPHRATTTTADGTDDTPAATKPAHKTKPQKLAMAEPADGAATDAAPAAKTSGSGSFAVQLAAPGSEADAKSASSRLAKKFASALDGYRLGFHKAESNGKSVYRVRVSSLSKEDAVSLCDKLKADGGTCFVARN